MWNRKTALIVVDVQNDFVEGGLLGMPGGLDTASAISQYIQQEPTDVLVTTQDWHVDRTEHLEQWGDHCLAGTDGAAIVDNVREAVESVKDIMPTFSVKKGMHDSGYSGFSDSYFPSHSGLTEWLKKHKVGKVTIVGIATDYCVQATAIDAIRAGFDVTVLTDMTVGTSPESVESSYEEMVNVGVYVTDSSR